ncbi:unnamed protein product [Cladocopium goreaui]|uniref:Pentacotripeptide-repeat region of PRORP domain-containing protein n=1 Tax=Cladocopium goreaui TaxID=2562237 RepID=A0A9P1CFX5_9DINO|nr:unnamed protein product [Cladocopium goreaui]
MCQVQIPPNQITFSAILPAQHWHCALDLCMASLQSDIVMDRVTFEAVIRSCGQHWPRSHALLMSMRVQIVSANRMTYNSILNSLKGHWELALRILEAMPSLEVQPDTVSYSLGATEWRWANALIQAMPSRSLRVDALGLRQAAMSGPWRPALELLQSLPEDSQVALSASYASVLLWQQALAVSESQVLGFNLLLKSMDGAQWQSASHILLQMASSQVQANMVTYNTFLSTLSWQQALVWLQRLSIDQTINFDLVTFGTIIRSCADGQQWRWALHFLHCIGTARLQCSLVLCNAALSACAWHRSLWLLKDLWNQQLVPDVVSINTVLNSFSSDSSAATGLRPWQLAVQLIGTAFLGLRLDDTSLTMSSMALSRATQWCRSLQSLDLGSARLRHVAMGACEGLGRWRHALRLLPQDSTEVSFNTGISACEKGGAWQSSLQLLQMMSAVRLVPDVIGFSSAISASEKRHQWRVAVRLLEVMLVAEVLPNIISYNSALRAVQSAHWPIALILFESMVRNRMHNLIGSNSALLACEQGSCYRLATVLLNTDLPRLCFQMMAARSECPAKQTALVRSETGEF